MGLRLSRSRFLILALLLAIAVAGFMYHRNSNSTRRLEHPEYLSFAGNYVFSVPKDYLVDDRSLPGIQLVYQKQMPAADTLNNAYDAGSISLQPISFLADHKSSTFKKYVQDTYVPGIDKALAPDVQVEFTSVEGWDVARITANKNNQAVRFVYLKNGLHPVSIVAKQETAALKKIEQTISDVESTDLKDYNATLRQAILGVTQLIKNQSAQELYKHVGSDLKDKNTEADLNNALQAIAPYTTGSIAINGVSYTVNPTLYSSIMNFEPATKDTPPASGILYMDVVNGQWEVKGLQLPNPAANQVK